MGSGRSGKGWACKNPREPGGSRRPQVAAPSVILSLSKNPCILGLNTNTVIPSASSGQALRSAQDDNRAGSGRQSNGPMLRHSERSEESPHYSLPNHPLLKSFHVGLAEMIKATFLARSHPLICFSRRIASRALLKVSMYTSRLMLYLLVNPGISLCLCSKTRRSRSFVIPVYKGRYFPAMTYT